MKAKIKLGLADLTPEEKCAKGTLAVTNGDEDPAVPGNGPVLAALETATTALGAAKQKLTDLLNEVTAQRIVLAQAGAAFDLAYADAASFTESATSCDAEAMSGAGFELRNKPGPVQPVGQVQDLTVRLNGKTGASKLSWKPEENAVFYIAQCNTDLANENGWKDVAKVTKARATVQGAEAGKPCYFRVQAWNSKGDGPWSGIASRPVL